MGGTYVFFPFNLKHLVPDLANLGTFKSNIDGDQYDIYSRDNPAVDEVWESLLIDSLTAITEDEMHRLPGVQHTAPLYGGEPGYAVITEAFHQLHCLVREGSIPIKMVRIMADLN